MRTRLRIAILTGALCAAASVRGGNLMYTSWGDRIMLSEGPYRLDTPERIDTAFARWKANYGADAVLWRISDEVIRRECACRITGPFYRAYYDKVSDFHTRFGDAIKVAREAARRHGQKFFLYETFLDWGCPTNVLYGDTVPFPWQNRLTKAHPEWEEVDLRGNRHFGVIDLSVPDARRAAVDKFVRYAKRYDPDGVYVCDRSHSHPAEHADQYGFGSAIVAEYARRYGIDITKDARFDWTSASFAPHSPKVEAWRRLRGEYLVQFYRELRAALPGRLVYLALPRGAYLGAPYGNLFVDTARLVRERLADGLVINVYSGRNLYPRDTRPHAARGYLSSCDDSLNVPGKRAALAALAPLCRANGIRLFYAGNTLEENLGDGVMLVETFPRAANLRVFDGKSLLSGPSFSLEGEFRLAGKSAKDALAPRLVNKYAHDLTDERGWELYVTKGRLALRLELNLPAGGRKDFSLVSTREFPLDRWVKVSAVFDGERGRVALALDGVLAGTAQIPAGTRLAANPRIPVVFGSYAHGGQYADLLVGPVTLRGHAGKTVMRFDFAHPANPVAEAAEGVNLKLNGTLPTVQRPDGTRAFDLSVR